MAFRLSAPIQMPAKFNVLMDMLKRDDLESFLEEYERYRLCTIPKTARETRIQTAISSVLRRRFRRTSLPSMLIARLWMLAEYKRLLPIDDDIRAFINQKIDDALNAN